MFYEYNINTHNSLIDFRAVCDSTNVMEMCRTVEVFKIPQTIINATKVTLKCIKTQNNFPKIWKSECLTQAGIVFQRIALWTIYGPNIQNRWFEQTPWRLQLKLQVLREIMPFDRSVYTDISKIILSSSASWRSPWRNCLQHYTAQLPRRLDCSSTPLWETSVSQDYTCRFNKVGGTAG
jgi:hypothetical protein